jgi:hypothetical protein
MVSEAGGQNTGTRRIWKARLITLALCGVTVVLPVAASTHALAPPPLLRRSSSFWTATLASLHDASPAGPAGEEALSARCESVHLCACMGTLCACLLLLHAPCTTGETGRSAQGATLTYARSVRSLAARMVQSPKGTIDAVEEAVSPPQDNWVQIMDCMQPRANVAMLFVGPPDLSKRLRR